MRLSWRWTKGPIRRWRRPSGLSMNQERMVIRMTDKLKGDSGIRLRAEIAMGKDTTMGKVPVKPATPKFKEGGLVNLKKYGSGMRRSKTGC